MGARVHPCCKNWRVRLYHGLILVYAILSFWAIHLTWGRPAPIMDRTEDFAMTDRAAPYLAS